MPSRDELESQRIAALYKRLVLLGQARVPLAAGRRLVGPDCAYHLYFRNADSEERGAKRARSRSARRRSRAPRA